MGTLEIQMIACVAGSYFWRAHKWGQIRESERERAEEQLAPALSSRLHCSFPLSSLLSPLSFPLSSKTAGYAGKTGKDQNNALDLNTVEPRFNEPLYNKVLGITNDFLQPGQNYSKMCGTEPRFNEILVVTNTIHEPKRKICLDITNKCHHVIKDKCQSDQQG